MAGFCNLGREAFISGISACDRRRFSETTLAVYCFENIASHVWFTVVSSSLCYIYNAYFDSQRVKHSDSSLPLAVVLAIALVKKSFFLLTLVEQLYFSRRQLLRAALT